MNREISKKNLVKKIAAVMAMTMIPFQLLLVLGQQIQLPYITSLVYIVSIVLVLFAARITGWPEAFTSNAENTGMFFTQGWYLLSVSILLGILNFLSIDFTYFPSVSKVIIFLTQTALGVVFEELLFRGVIQNKITEYFETNEKPVWKALVISSLIFGLMHLLNLVGKPYFLLGTLTQVVYTFSIGLLIGCVYWCSKSIWTAFILHFTFNLLGNYSVLFYKNLTSQGDITLWDAMIQIVLILPCIFFAHRIYKRNERKDFIRQRQHRIRG